MATRFYFIIIGVCLRDSWEEVADAVSRALGIHLEPHDSSHGGGDYYLGDWEDEEVYVYPNWDILDDEPFYEEALDCPVLIRFNYPREDPTERARVLGEKLGAPCRVLDQQR